MWKAFTAVVFVACWFAMVLGSLTILSTMGVL